LLFPIVAESGQCTDLFLFFKSLQEKTPTESGGADALIKVFYGLISRRICRTAAPGSAARVTCRPTTR
jgi:hypothetical protein